MGSFVHTCVSGDRYGEGHGERDDLGWKRITRSREDAVGRVVRRQVRYPLRLVTKHRDEAHRDAEQVHPVDRLRPAYRFP